MFYYYGGKRRLAARYQEPRFDTIVEPFADVHLCNVEVNDNAPCTHQVVMLADGNVLDPLCDEPKRLTDYFKVNNVAAVVRYREAA